MIRGAFLLVILAAASALDAVAQGTAWSPAMALAPESRLWIEGSSNVNRFTCQARGLAQTIRVGSPSEVWEITGLPEPLQRAVLGIPVESLRCADRRMDGDLHQALRAREHPHLTFRLWSYERVGAETPGPFTVHAVGAIGLAGAESVVRVDARVEPRPDGTVRLRGRKTLRMTDFGIRPPTAFLGLVRAKDEIVVRFDLVADPAAVAAAERSSR